ncbi:MAG: anti-sigma regulatory factor [Bacteroidales bacterium]|nr:anti-sigma regulatory factor [Bacteroidales bacterium]
MNLHFDIVSGDFIKAGYVSSEVKKVLKQMELPADFIRKVVIACYEAEMNIVVHANNGSADIEFSPGAIIMKFEDEGPGISNINLAMQEGFSTASEHVREMGFGAGMGLPNIARNSDKVDIKSELGKGTCVTITNHIKYK